MLLGLQSLSCLDPLIFQVFLNLPLREPRSLELQGGSTQMAPRLRSSDTEKKIKDTLSRRALPKKEIQKKSKRS